MRLSNVRIYTFLAISNNVTRLRRSNIRCYLTTIVNKLVVNSHALRLLNAIIKSK